MKNVSSRGIFSGSKKQRKTPAFLANSAFEQPLFSPCFPRCQAGKKEKPLAGKELKTNGKRD